MIQLANLIRVIYSTFRVRYKLPTITSIYNLHITFERYTNSIRLFKRFVFERRNGFVNEII